MQSSAHPLIFTHALGCGDEEVEAGAIGGARFCPFNSCPYRELHPGEGMKALSDGRPVGEVSILRTILGCTAAMLAMFTTSDAALAQQATYSWIGMGQGSGKFTSYRMTINVTGEGTAVKGLFRQPTCRTSYGGEPRPQKGEHVAASSVAHVLQFKASAPPP